MESSVRRINKIYKLSLIKALAFGLIIFSVGIFLGWVVEHYHTVNFTKQVVNTIKPIRENNFNYHYIYPLLAYDFTKANPYFQDIPLDSQLDNFVNDQIQKQNAQSISVYVRNFSDNQWAGTNEDVKYHPGSMLKVLIMMAYFRQAELDQAILDKSFTYSKSVAQESSSLDFSSPSNLTIGQNYPVKDLIENMIANSDNGAEALLLDNVSHEVLNSAYKDLNIPNPDSATVDYTISARQYVAFLRILYNATYLTEPFSEQALGLMAKSTYKDGLTAGVPASVEVSHKFGERVDGSENNVSAVELHDCGIVYAPAHPYSICVMTKGQDIQKLTEVIKNTSELVYKAFIANSPN